MSAHYRILLKNSNGATLNFCFFSQPPVLNSAVSTSDVYTNVWIKKRVANGGKVDVGFTKDFYAYAGQSPSKPAPGVSVEGGVTKAAILGQKNNPGSLFQMVNDGGIPNLTVETHDSSVVDSDFSIACQGGFVRDDNWLVGMAQVDASTGNVVPVFTTVAEPHTTVRMKPVMTYYVARCENQRGEILDYQRFSNDAAMLDFSAQNAYGFEVEYTREGTWVTTPHSQTSWNGVMLGLAGEFEPKRPSQNRPAAKQPGNIGTGVLDPIAGANDSHLPLLAKIRDQLDKIEAEIQDALNGKGNVQKDDEGQGIINVSKWLFQAYLSPPAGKDSSTIWIGATAIAAAMIALGYGVHYEKTTAPDGGTKVKFWIGLPARQGVVSEDINTAKEDWKYAVLTDTQKDGHTATDLTKATDQPPTQKQRIAGTDNFAALDMHSNHVSNGVAIESF